MWLKTQDSIWTTILGGGISSVVYMLGGIDKLLIAFTIFMVVDYVTGLLRAFATKEVNSKRGFRGLAKKIAMVSFIIVAVQLDIITGAETPIMRTAILMFLISVEGISILENLSALGLPIPKFLIQTLERYKDDNSGGIEDIQKRKDDQNGSK